MLTETVLWQNVEGTPQEIRENFLAEVMPKVKTKAS